MVDVRETVIISGALGAFALNWTTLFIILHKGVKETFRLANPLEILIYLLLPILLLSIYYLCKVAFSITDEIFEWISFGIMIAYFIFSLGNTIGILRKKL